jgi:energy-coupling factor transporter ATP-binding protein EcfA2
VGFIGLAAFAVLIVWHGRVLDDESAAQRQVAVCSDALLRGTGQFKKLASDGKRFAANEHPYAADLDLFGPGSLFQRLSVTHTRFGEDALAGFLTAPAAPSEVVRRQAAVRALGADLELRQRFESFGFSLVRDDRKGENVRHPPPEPTSLFAWARETRGVLGDKLLLVGARVAPLVTLAALVGWSQGLTPFVFLVGLVVNAFLLMRSSAVCNRAFQACSASQGAFRTYAPMLRVIEEQTLDAELLKDQKARLEKSTGGPETSGRASRGGRRPSQVMAELDRILGWYDLRYNGMIYPIVNLLTLWDVQCTIALEHWRGRAGPGLETWFSIIGEFEALSSLGGLLHDEPDFCFPEVADTAPPFVAEGLGHPLIARDKRVTNDVSLSAPGHALLVTGSNMSGKSTLLRSMGLAAVLAQAGAPVCARRLALAPALIRTSLRVSDSLDSGVSHFYAEVKKLRAAIDATEQRGKVLFLLDEVLHGTNSRERQVGARWLLAELLRRGAAGAISTHDEELCRLPAELMDRVELVHFRETVENDQMTFDYRLREGPVKAGNALRVMRLAGLDVPLQ